MKKQIEKQRKKKEVKSGESPLLQRVKKAHQKMCHCKDAKECEAAVATVKALSSELDGMQLPSADRAAIDALGRKIGACIFEKMATIK